MVVILMLVSQGHNACLGRSFKWLRYNIRVAHVAP